jgi:hypothetical protein
MKATLTLKQRLRRRSEEALRLAVLRDLGRGQPGTAAPVRPRGGLLWRALFVPVYRRVPWAAKQRAMQAMGMTASGWRAPERRPGEPWRPPERPAAGSRDGAGG